MARTRRAPSRRPLRAARWRASARARLRAGEPAAASALMPIATPPHPGTAVNEPARSMVSRMKRRLSIAWVCNETGSARGARMLRTVAMRIDYRRFTLRCKVGTVPGPLAQESSSNWSPVKGSGHSGARLSQFMPRADSLHAFGDHFRIVALQICGLLETLAIVGAPGAENAVRETAGKLAPSRASRISGAALKDDGSIRSRPPRKRCPGSLRCR